MLHDIASPSPLTPGVPSAARGGGVESHVKFRFRYLEQNNIEIKNITLIMKDS